MMSDIACESCRVVARTPGTRRRLISAFKHQLPKKCMTRRCVCNELREPYPMESAAIVSAETVNSTRNRRLSVCYPHGARSATCTAMLKRGPGQTEGWFEGSWPQVGKQHESRPEHWPRLHWQKIVLSAIQSCRLCCSTMQTDTEYSDGNLRRDTMRFSASIRPPRSDLGARIL